MKSLLILGRQPALGLAELESLYGAENIQPFAGFSALVNIAPQDIHFARLGGSTRLCKILTKLPSTHWPEIKNYLLDTMPKHATALPDGKLTFGVSIFGIKVNLKELERVLLEVKKKIKATGRSVRIVPNKLPELNAAQVLHNKLTAQNGWELVIVSDGITAYLAQTVHIQDIEGYAARDQARPYRDTRVGMLPPKLAQVIVNLAGTHTLLTNSDLSPDPHAKVARMLDPFCGTGVTLQEASLVGYDVYGTDLEPRMVEYSIGNLHWLRQKWNDIDNSVRIELGDATSHTWDQPIDMVAAETYLGVPLTNMPKPGDLRKIIDNVDAIHEKFLRNIAPQLKPGTRLCLAVPAWSVVSDAFVRLPVLDHLKELGYNEVKFVHASKSDLIYHRENQLVARELVVITKE